MAEINIERKKKPVWPWILLLVLAAIIGWLVYEYMIDQNATTSQAEPHTIDIVLSADSAPHQRHVATV